MQPTCTITITITIIITNMAFLAIAHIHAGRLWTAYLLVPLNGNSTEIE